MTGLIVRGVPRRLMQDAWWLDHVGPDEQAPGDGRKGDPMERGYQNDPARRNLMAMTLCPRLGPRE